MSYKCAFCGQIHDDLPMDLAFLKPEDYLRIPEFQRARRAKINQDLCVIDDKTHIIRGVLPIPVQDGKEDFRWGVWIIVQYKFYKRYLELWNANGSKEPPFPGWLSAKLPGYPDTYRLEGKVQLGGRKDRPIFRLNPSEHPLTGEQLNGITQARLHEILKIAMPSFFENLN